MVLRCGETTQPQSSCQRVSFLGLGCNATVGTVPPVYHSPGAAGLGVFSCGNPAGSEQIPSFEPQEENCKGAAHLAAPHSHPATPAPCAVSLCFLQPETWARHAPKTSSLC